MTTKLFAHVNNEADRQALVALHEKEMNVREKIENKDRAALRDWKEAGATEQEYAEMAALMSAIDEIAKKYDHLLPKMKDPYADLYADLL